MSRIVIDARESGTSTGRYIDNLLAQLQQLKPEHQFVVLTKSSRLEALRQLVPNFEVVAADYPEFTFAEQLGFRRQLNALHADLVHFGMTQQPVGYRGRTVTTIHDLTTLRFTNPAKNPLVYRLKQRVYAYVVKRGARKAAAVLTPSQFVKDDVVRFTGIDASKITVTYEAADPITDKPEPLAALKDKKFIMYIGRPTPHKNLERLIDAFVQLQAKHPELVLVLAGKLDANYQRIQATVQQRQIKNVVFADFVGEGQLRWLYEHCAAYVFPSLSEGFGLPGLEAMAHGAPVVSSNATCLPEVYGDAAYYFDPTKVEAIAHAIDEVLIDPLIREDLIEKGAKQVKKYSWQKTAEQTLEVYQKALG